MHDAKMNYFTQDRVTFDLLIIAAQSIRKKQQREKDYSTRDQAHTLDDSTEFCFKTQWKFGNISVMI